jgi:hypothetical protein
MFAIQHRETGLFVTGTDFSRKKDGGFVQFVSKNPMKLYESKSAAEKDRKRRNCGRKYKVVEVI